MARNSNKGLFGFLRTKDTGLEAPAVMSQNEHIYIHGLQIELLRKNIKNVHLRVYPPKGIVRVSAPTGLPVASIEKIIERKLSWIREQQTKSIQIKPLPRFASGERHEFAGASYPLYVFNTSGRPNVILSDNKTFEMNVPVSSSIEQREKLLDSWYRSQLNDLALPLFENWQKIMGVAPSQWRIKKMKTRWGSCNVVDARIWLSLELAKKPPHCIEYVIVHELAHLIERGHGKRFVSVMDKHLPNLRTVRRELNFSNT